MAFTWKIVANNTTNLGFTANYSAARKTAAMFETNNKIVEIIHQPTQEVFYRFDDGKIFLRTQDGRLLPLKRKMVK